MCVCVHARVRVCAYAYVCVCVCVCVRACMRAHTHTGICLKLMIIVISFVRYSFHLCCFFSYSVLWLPLCTVRLAPSPFSNDALCIDLNKIFCFICLCLAGDPQPTSCGVRKICTVTLKCVVMFRHFAKAMFTKENEMDVV